MKLCTFHRRYQHGIITQLTTIQRKTTTIRMQPPAGPRFDSTTLFSSMVTVNDPSGEFKHDRYPSVDNGSWYHQNWNSSLMTNRAPLKLSDMIEQIPFSIRQRKRLNISPGCTKQDPVLQLMRRLDEESLRSEIQKYCYYDSSISYTRNLISTDNDNYTLLLLCWNNNNQRSPIHNHPGDGCYMRVVSGSIVEQLYDVRQHPHTSSSSTYTHATTGSSGDQNAIPVALECIATNHYGTNQVAFIDDNIGYHSIGCSPVNVNGTAYGSSNNSASIPGAMSLHLYCPPIKQCRIVVRTSDVPDVGCSNDYKQSRIFVRDSGPMYHHTEYGCRKE